MPDTTGMLVNEATGADSSNINTVQGSITDTVTVRNQGTATTTADLDISTGGNSAVENTLVGDLQSGDAAVEIENEVSLPSFDTALLPEPASFPSFSFQNSLTGAGSTNTNTLAVDQQRDLNISQSQTTETSYDINVDTGGNTLARNTEAGSLITGSVRITLGNTVNPPGGGGVTPPPGVVPTPGPGGGGGIGGGEPVATTGDGGLLANVPFVGGIGGGDSVAAAGMGGGEYLAAGATTLIWQLLILATVLVMALRPLSRRSAIQLLRKW